MRHEASAVPLSQKALVTGGAGYIGAHVAYLLLKSGYQVDVIDNLSTGDTARLEALARAGGAAFAFHRCDIRAPGDLEAVFAASKPDIVLHFAGLKDIARSFEDTEHYYAVNVDGTANVLDAAGRHGTRRVIFSSSAAVYGGGMAGPVRESHHPNPASPYGTTKVIGETLVAQWADQAPRHRRALVLRYFNPCGVHAALATRRSMVPGQTLSLADTVLAVASGLQPHLTIFGRNHATRDGTCYRDFVHVLDIAQAHIAAARQDARDLKPTETINIGSGAAHSVLEFVAAFQRVTGLDVPCRIGAPRPGDTAWSCADISRALECLSWRPTMGLSEICRSLAKIDLIDFAPALTHPAAAMDLRPMKVPNNPATEPLL